KRSVPGVVTVKSTPLQRRIANAPVTTLDDVWVDVGALSGADVRRLGIQMLDPIVRDLPAWTYADYIAGPNAALRVGCAAVAQATRRDVTEGETIFLLTSLRSFGNDGLEAALRGLGKIYELMIVDRSADGADNQTTAVINQRAEKPAFIPETSGITAVQMLSPRARYAGSLVESVKLEDANALRKEVERFAHVAATQTEWISLTQPRPTTTITDSYSATANLLKTLADVAGVSGHEAEVRGAILNSLPSWAPQRAVTYAEGNLVVEVGPNTDPVMFIAHQDEVGFEISSINTDGTVSLRNRGGLYQSLWEGQPALLHLDRTQGDTGQHRRLNGVFVPR